MTQCNLFRLGLLCGVCSDEVEYVEVGSVEDVWIPIRNCLYQKFIFVSILKPRR